MSNNGQSGSATGISPAITAVIIACISTVAFAIFGTILLMKLRSLRRNWWTTVLNGDDSSESSENVPPRIATRKPSTIFSSPPPGAPEGLTKCRLVTPAASTRSIKEVDGSNLAPADEDEDMYRHESAKMEVLPEMKTIPSVKIEGVRDMGERENGQ